MIPAIIVMLMRHYQKNNPQQFLILKAKLFYIAKIVLLIALAFCIVLLTQAQEKNLSYTIKRNGKKVGDMKVKEVREGKKVSLKLESDVKTSFILSFSAKGVEESKFDSGILVYSSVYQKLNGNERVNKKIKYVDNAYVISSNGKEEKLTNIKIYYNLICIYSHEPVSASLIFSDRYQKFLSIQKIEDHHYKIKFPDGSANDYWYRNGQCIKIEVDHDFYSAVMELNQ